VKTVLPALSFVFLVFFFVETDDAKQLQEYSMKAMEAVHSFLCTICNCLTMGYVMGQSINNQYDPLGQACDTHLSK
jgi:hypothetical protein